MQPTDRIIRMGDYVAPPAQWLTDDDFVVHNLAAGRAEAAVAEFWRTRDSESPLRD